MPLAQWLAHVADQITAHPPLVAGLIGLATGWGICPAYMYFLAVVSEWRWPKYKDQFKAFMPGNVFLGLVFGSSCYLASDYRRSGQHVALFEGTTWVWLPFVIGLVMVVALTAIDVFGAFAYSEADKSFKYHWRQLISWTKIWHNVVVYGAYGFLLVRVGVPGLVSAPWGIASYNNIARAVLVVALTRWVCYLKEDTVHPKHATGHVAVSGVQWTIGLATVSLTFIAVAAVIPAS